VTCAHDRTAGRSWAPSMRGLAPSGDIRS
jgi:hypothetical protein